MNAGLSRCKKLSRVMRSLHSSTMTEIALNLGCALMAFGPVISLFALIVYQKAQLVIVVTTAAFFFLLGATPASFFWTIFHAIGLRGPLAAIIPGVFFQFVARCAFVSIYHKVERVIQVTLHKQLEEERYAESGGRRGSSDASVRPAQRNREEWSEIIKLRLQLNDASCGVAAGVGFGGMHAIMLFGTLLASQMKNNVGVLYQESCPAMPSLAVSAIFACLFSILDIFWMLFTFFGMRRRLMYHRGTFNENGSRAIGGWFGNSRTGGNLALLFTLISHFFSSVLTTSDNFKLGCTVSLSSVAAVVLVTAYIFWAGVGRIYMPPAQSVILTNSMSRTHSE